MNINKDVLGNSICNDGYDVALNVTMLATSDLLQLGYALMELSKTCVWMEDGKSGINFSGSESMNSLLSIVVPEHFVPVRKGFQCEEF